MSINFETGPGLIWLDGSLVDWTEAKLHALSHSLHFASAVFEGLRVYDGQIFELEAHTNRLFLSSQIVEMTIPYERSQINRACLDVIAVQNLKEAYIRPIAWRGTGSMAPTCRNLPVHVAIAAWEWPIYYSPEAKAKGICLTLSKWRRPPPDSAPTQAKASGLYMICSLAKNDAERRGFDDALLLDYRGLVSETTSSNIFFVVNGTLKTPIPDCFLNGITRQIVVGLARDLGIPVEECHMTMEDLAEASDAFVTGTAAEVTPISQIDDLSFRPGNISFALMDAYRDLVRLRKNALVG